MKHVGLFTDPADLATRGRTLHVVYRGAWASRPVSGLTTGDLAWMTDIANGALFWWDSGANAWLPKNEVFLYARAGSFSSPIATLTGVTDAAFILPGVGTSFGGVRVPAGIAVDGRTRFNLKYMINRTTAVATFTSQAVVMQTDGSFNGAYPLIAQTGISATANRHHRVDLNYSASGTTRVFRENRIGPQSVQTGASSDTPTGINLLDEHYMQVGVAGANTGDIFQLIYASLSVVAT